MSSLEMTRSDRRKRTSEISVALLALRRLRLLRMSN
jgi:hypothetical protein